MKNKEKFKKEILDILSNHLTITNDGKAADCGNIDCEDCKFFLNRECNKDVSSGFIEEWLEEEHVESGRYIPQANETFWTVELHMGEVKPVKHINYAYYPKHLECYFDMIHHAFKSEEECQEYIDFWGRVRERIRPFKPNELNYYLYYDYLDEDVRVKHSMTYCKTRYYFGRLTDTEQIELIQYLGEENIKKYLLGVYK